MKINKKIIQELVDYLKEFDLTEIEYSDGTTKVKVSKSSNISVASSTQPKSLRKDRFFLKGAAIFKSLEKILEKY